MLSTTGYTVNDVLMRFESTFLTKLFVLQGGGVNSSANLTLDSHAVHTSALVNTNLDLSQLEQLHVLSNMTMSYEDPDKSLQRHTVLRRRRARLSRDRSVTSDIWSSPEFRRTAASPSSALITVRGPFSTRWAIQDFGVDLIQTLSAPDEPATILWALTGDTCSGSKTADWNTVDVLKYFTWQALRASVIGTSLTEKDTPIRYSRFYTNRTEEDWLIFFSEIVDSLFRQRQQIIVVINMAAIQAFWGDDNHRGRGALTFGLIHGLSRLVAKRTAMRLKVILLVIPRLGQARFQIRWQSPSCRSKLPRGSRQRTARSNNRADIERLLATDRFE